MKQILQGDWIEQLRTLPDGCVQCCVTSPPYWGLRSYLPDKVQLRGNLTQDDLAILKKELTLLGLSDTIRL